MTRPFWSGQLKISLVSFGVQLFPAVNAYAGISFHQIDRATGQRVRHRNVVDDDRSVENSEIVKGYEYSKGNYIVVEPDEIAKLRIPSESTIEISRFVDIGDLLPSLFEKPYFVVPEPKESPDAFAVIRKAMEQTKKAGIGEMAFGGREHLVAIALPSDKSFGGLMAYTLRYAEELRKSEEYLTSSVNAHVDKKQLAMATDLIQAYSGPLSLEEFKDDYEAALHQLIEAKQKNQPPPLEEPASQKPTVVNLMDALRRSVTQAKQPGTVQKRTSRSAPPPKKGPMLVKAGRRKHKAA